MQIPQFVDGQFVNGSLLNDAMTLIEDDFAFLGSGLHSPGLLNPGSLTFTAASPSNLSVTINAPSPFAVLFGSGSLVDAHGTVSGATTFTYALDFTSLVPSSGAPVTAYILASYGTIGQDSVQVIGPPEGHPDYDPDFAPFTFYTDAQDTIVITASLTPPNNNTTFALASLPLSVGQTIITQNSIVSGSVWKYASSVLNPTGVVSGTYVGATVQVAPDGRIIGVSGVSYGPLAANNVWTGTNAFNKGITATDLNGGGGVTITGTSNGAVLGLLGNGATTPNKYIRAVNGSLQFINSAFTAAVMTMTDTGGLTAAGNITSSGGNVSASNAVSAGAGGFSTTGNAQANLAVTAGTSMTAGGNITSTTGSITATAGNVNAGGTLNSTAGILVAGVSNPILNEHGGFQVLGDGSSQIYAVNKNPIGIGMGIVGTLIGFFFGNGLVGSITQNGGSVQFNQTSDERVKTILGKGDGSWVAKLPIWRGRYNKDPRRAVQPMILAHEMQALAPWTVTGKRGEVDPDTGKDIMMQVDWLSAMPSIVDYIQQVDRRLQAVEKKDGT